jgi:hypothetical protein
VVNRGFWLVMGLLWDGPTPHIWSRQLAAGPQGHSTYKVFVVLWMLVELQ